MRMLVSILLPAAATFTLQAKALDFGDIIRIIEARQEHREGGHERPGDDWYRPGDGKITSSLEGILFQALRFSLPNARAYCSHESPRNA